MYAKYIQVGGMIDYTAGTAGVSCGDIVIQGGTSGKLVGIPSEDIPANTLGALNTQGVFDVSKNGTASFSAGNPVYWDVSGKVATPTAGTNTRIGTAIADAGTATTAVRVLFSGVPQTSGGGSITPASAISSLTDESSGSASNTIRELEDATVADAVASLAAKINAILASLRQTGIINQ